MFSIFSKRMRTKMVFYIGIFFLSAVLLGVFLYRTEFSWFTLDGNKIEKLNAQATTDASQFLFDKAIEEFKQLNFIYRIKGENDLAARMMIKIGFQYSKNGEYLVGVPILKKVAFDERLSPKIRSEAIARIIMAYSGNEKLEIMQEIFNDDAEMMKTALGTGNIKSASDLRKAAVQLFERANSIYEYAYIDYVLAARKSYLLVGEIKSLSTEERITKKEEILSLVKKGDELTAVETIQSDFKRGSFNSDFLLSGQSQKLQAFAELSYIDSQYEKSATEVYTGLQTLRDTYYKNGYLAPSFLGTESFIRFYYASMLAHIHGVTYRKEIESILAPTMVETGNWGTTNRKIAWRFYENELTKPKNQRSSNYNGIMKLASILPDFNRFLIEKGWIDESIN